MTTAECLRLTLPFIACWSILSAAEWLANADLFNERGLLSWPILRLRVGMTARLGPYSRFGSPEAFKIAQVVRLLAGASLLLWPAPNVSAVALLFVVCSCAYTNFRACFGGDGSDQMGLIVAVGALLMASGLFIHDVQLAYSGVILIGDQALLAYFVAGASKVISPIWRSGTAVRGVMHTATFGNAWAAKFMTAAPSVSFAIGWTVILTEMLFPIAFISPVWLLAICLVGFAIFHLVNAYFMGLNSFVVAFLATYPTVIKLNFDINSWQ